MKKHQNKDGTFNGVKIFAELTGLHEDEIAWMFKRMQHLLNVDKKTKEEAKIIVTEEAKQKPWIKK